MNDSARFQQTRDAHRTELAEDYVEAILDFTEVEGEARLTELATRFGVAHPSVSKTLKRLEGEGLVILRPYRGIRLTEKGQALAVACRLRHHTVVAFLTALGLDAATAEIEAEGMEHHVGERTLELMRGFTASHLSAKN